MSKQTYSSFSSEDELDHLFNEQKGSGAKVASERNTGKKNMMENVMENLDKVLIGIAVLLLVVFFLRSQHHHRSKEAHKNVMNAVETNQKMPADKVQNQLDNGKIDDLLESYKAKILLQNKKRQDSKDSFNLHKSANQQDDVQDMSAKISQKYAESEKYIKHEARGELFNEKAQENHFQSLKLAKFNLETPKDDKQLKTLSFAQQKRKLQQKYSIQEQYDQLSMCIVIYAKLLKKDYAHQYVLQSIFNQDYKEYSVVYIADGHSQEQVNTVKQYIKEKDHNSQVTLVWNKERKYFLESTVSAVKNHCQKRSVTVLMDGNDELLGGQVFNLLNTFYRREGFNMLYGNFIEYYDSHKQFNLGFSRQYEQTQKQSNSYRLVPQKFGSIKTFKTRLLSFIKQSDFKDIYGNYYKQAGDYALMYPLLELSCGKVGYLPQYNYLYYGEEVDPATRKEQTDSGMAIKALEQYQCFTAYK